MPSFCSDTTPEEEPEKKKSLGDTDSSETDEEDKALEKAHKMGPKFTSIPEIIPEVGASGSAATTTSDTPSEAPIKKKPLKSALKKPKPGTYTAIPLTESPLTKPDETTPEKDNDKSPEGFVFCYFCISKHCACVGVFALLYLPTVFTKFLFSYC